MSRFWTKKQNDPVEFIHKDDIRPIMNFNEKRCLALGKKFMVDADALQRVINSVNSHSDIVDHKTRIAKKTSNIIQVMMQERPFQHENTLLVWL